LKILDGRGHYGSPQTRRGGPFDGVPVRFTKVVGSLPFGGIPYRFGYARLARGYYGTTATRGVPEERRNMFISRHLNGKRHLDTSIHEALHAVFGARLSEGDVRKTGVELAEFLWKLGYRKKDK
jgi:hypothetical protein